MNDTDDDGHGRSAEPSLDGLLNGLMGDMAGWPGMEDGAFGKVLQKQTQQHRDRMKREAGIFRDAFLINPAGRKALEAMLDMTLRRASWPVHAMQDAQMLMAYGIWREAENSFVAAIIEAIALAENGEVQRRDRL